MPYNNFPGNPCRHLKAMIHWILPSFWLPSLSRSIMVAYIATALLLGILRAESLYVHVLGNGSHHQDSSTGNVSGCDDLVM